jgi:hypothetical protein
VKANLSSITIQPFVVHLNQHVPKDHLEIPETGHTLDDLASDVSGTFGVFGGEWGGLEEDRGWRALAGGCQDREGS